MGDISMDGFDMPRHFASYKFSSYTDTMQFMSCIYIWYIDYVFTSYSMLATVFCGSCRVWRYRGGRDGHETLQQFMNFLGRGQEIQLESDTRQGQSHGTTAGRI